MDHRIQEECSPMHTEERTMGGPISEKRKPTRIQGEPNPLCIQEERSHMYTGSTNHYLQKERSLIYAEENDGGPIQEERNPTCIRRERSLMYTERAKLGFKRSDN